MAGRRRIPVRHVRFADPQPIVGDTLWPRLRELGGDLPMLAGVGFARQQVSAVDHVHDDVYELRLVVGGQGAMRVAGEELALRTGDLVVLNPGDVHRTVAANRLRTLAV
nr:AraC family ligand binding domain-containing protein [Planctomycetota bacterium]